MIDSWLETFRNAWTHKDLDAISKLFSADVDYWETPFKFIKGIDAVIQEWEVINEQHDINIETEVLISNEKGHTVRWMLEYKRDMNETTKWRGLYIIQLNHNNVCDYFYQVGEKQ